MIAYLNTAALEVIRVNKKNNGSIFFIADDVASCRGLCPHAILRQLAKLCPLNREQINAVYNEKV